MKLASFSILVFVYLLFTSCANTRQSGITKDTLSELMLNPIATDSAVATFGFRDRDFYEVDKKFNKIPKHVREYSDWYNTGDSIVLGKNTLYAAVDIYFNSLGYITKLEDREKVNLFFYDTKGNLVLRKRHTEDKTSYIDRATYDTHGNLISYYQYKIDKDSVYHFRGYEEYSYEKIGSKTIVTNKELYKWSKYRSSVATKEYDSSQLLQTMTSIDELPASGNVIATFSEYHYEVIQGKPYLQSERTTTSLKTSEYLVESFERDSFGRLQSYSYKNTKSAGYYEFKNFVTYPKKNRKVTEKTFTITIPKEQQRYFKNEIEGLQTTFNEIFDTHNNVIERIEISSEDGRTNTKTTSTKYVYDQYFNWTQKSVRYEVVSDPEFEYDDEYDDYNPDDDILKYY